jgi:hypothetical protein
MAVIISNRGVFDGVIDFLSKGVDAYARPFATMAIFNDDVELSLRTLRTAATMNGEWASIIYEAANPQFPQNLCTAIETHAFYIEHLRIKERKRYEDRARRVWCPPRL